MTGGVVMDRTTRYVGMSMQVPADCGPFKSCHRLRWKNTGKLHLMDLGWFGGDLKSRFLMIVDDFLQIHANTSSLCFASCLPHCLDQVAAAAATGALLWPGSVARQAGQPVRVRWDTIGIQWYSSGFWLTCWTSSWRVCFFSPWFSHKAGYMTWVISQSVAGVPGAGQDAGQPNAATAGGAAGSGARRTSSGAGQGASNATSWS